MLFDVSTAVRPPLSVNRVVDFADSTKRSQVFDGFDFTISARKNRLLMAGGTSTGRTATVNCEAFDSPDVRFCDNRPPFLTRLKVLGSYTLPYDLQVSGTFQSIPGPPLQAATSEWLHPTDVLQGRLVKIGGQVTFWRSPVEV